MVDRVYLSEVKNTFKIENNCSCVNLRGLSLRYGNYQARQKFTDYAALMKDLGRDLKREHGFCAAIGTLFDITILSAFGSIDTVISATAKFVHGLAAATLHPALLIKKDPLIQKRAEQKKVEQQKKTKEKQINHKNSDEDFEAVNKLLDETLESLKIDETKNNNPSKNKEVDQLNAELKNLSEKKTDKAIENEDGDADIDALNTLLDDTLKSLNKDQTV